MIFIDIHVIQICPFFPFSSNAASHQIKQELLFVGQESGKRFAMRDIVRKGIKPPVLIFVQSKERAKELFSELMYDNIMVDVIHAERTQLQVCEQ